ncbi:formate hydrogenlyase transcriptional activator [hydrocarbon metagenome]|uniref:Formate hydrogenlyase transcriptional activator n=1 Tax=hydrocarbon metagenome TaxID=938273 RepID=A0A0W8FTC3_9ZZZZ
MKKADKTRQQLLDELQELKGRMMESEGTLRAILSGEVDGLVVKTEEGDRVFTLSGADHPYRIMVETMTEGAVTLAADGTILFCNQRFANMVKGPLEKIVGSSIYQYFSSTDIQLFKTLIERGLKGKSKAEMNLQTACEKSVPALLSMNNLQHTDIPGVLCMIVTDLTEQKHNEEMRIEERALQKSHDKLEQQVEERTVKLRTALSEIKTMKEKLEAENIYFRQENKKKHQFDNIIGQSDGLKYVLYRAQQVAPADTTILVLGETGTGKELIAAAIHDMSPRKDKPLITVNCAALPGNLIESELFGREKGAFTGADVRRMGRFEIANDSTICLDEIGELPLELQGKLLRVIQHSEFERLGSSQTIKVDVRIIATTNRNLEEEILQGRFRQDLYYRLNVFPITVPPLRLRKDDIPLMVQAFMERYSRKLGKKITTIPKETMKILQDYPWPGNVRELESIIERAVILCPGPVLQLADKLAISSPPLSSAMRTLEDMERIQILKILTETKWRIEGKDGAAAILGIHPSTLRARLHKLEITRPDTKEPH